MSADQWGYAGNGPAVDTSLGDDHVARFDVRTARDLMQTPDPPPEHALLGPLVYRGHRTIIVGDTGHGKTTLGLRMLGAIVAGEPMLGYTGAGVGPVLVLDLEQGIRSIKRGLREAGLDESDDVLYVSAPDGLALDQDPAHLAALNAALSDHHPVALLLDPYYKAHRADDPNAERNIVDLMRQLDALRVIYQFALLLPAHPRKAAPDQHGSRRLTIHDVAGSGAVTRGAEIVLGLERLGTGYARLRYLKDRDGDLPVGDAVGLLYDRDSGFSLQVDTGDEDLERAILATPRPWLTAKEWRAALNADGVKAREERVRTMLAALAERDPPVVAYTVGPPGRHATAHCYSTDPEAWDHPGSPDQLLLESVGDPGDPPSLLREGVPGITSTSPGDPGSVGSPDPDDDPWTW